MRQTRLHPASLQAFCHYSSHLIHFNCPVLGQFQPIRSHAICSPISFKDKRITGFLRLSGLSPSFDQALVQFLLSFAGRQRGA